MIRDMVMAGLQAWVEVDVEGLKAERTEEDEGGENLAGTAGGGPAVDPDEHHAGEEDVGESEDGEDKRGPEGEGGAGEADADVGRDQAESSDDGGDAEQAEEDARGEVSGKA